MPILDSIEINKANIRREYQRSVSPQALTDIIDTLIREIQTELEERDAEQVLKDLKHIVNSVMTEKNKLLIPQRVSASIIIAIGFYFFPKSITTADPLFWLIVIPAAILALAHITYSNAVAFEHATKNVGQHLTEEQLSAYPLALQFISRGWQARTQTFFQDSSMMQRRLALEILESYITEIDKGLKALQSAPQLIGARSA